VAPGNNDDVVVNGTLANNINLRSLNHTAITLGSVYLSHVIFLLENFDRTGTFSVGNLTLRDADIDVDDWSSLQVTNWVDSDNTSKILVDDFGSLLFTRPTTIGGYVYLDGNSTLACSDCTFTNGLEIQNALSVTLDTVTFAGGFSTSTQIVSTASVTVSNGATVELDFGFVYPRNTTVNVTQGSTFILDGWFNIPLLTVGTGSSAQLFPTDYVVSPTVTVRSRVAVLAGTGEVDFDSSNGTVALLGNTGTAAVVFTGLLALDGNVVVQVESPYTVSRLGFEQSDNQATLVVASSLTLNGTANLSGKASVLAGGLLAINNANFVLTQGITVAGELSTSNGQITSNGTVTVNPSGSVTVSGNTTISGLALNGQLTIDASTSKLDVRGNWNQGANSTFTVNSLSIDNAPLKVGGNAAVAGTLVFSLLEDPPTEGNTTYKVGDVTGNVTGTFATVTPAGEKSYDPDLTVIYEAHAILLHYAPSSGGNNNNPDNMTWIIVGVVVGSVVLLAAIVIVAVVVVRKRRAGYTSVK